MLDHQVSPPPSPPSKPQVLSTRRRWKRLSALLPIVIAIALFVGSVGVIRGEMEQYNLADIGASITSIPPVFLLLAIALVGFNYWLMTGYDWLALCYIRQSLPYGKVALVSVISYGISNTVGAAFLSGGALRYRFYTAWGLSPVRVAQVIAFCSLSFWLGLLTMGGVLFLTGSVEIPDSLQILPGRSLQSIGLFALVIVAVYILFSVFWRRSLRVGSITIPHLSLPIALGQIGLTCVDWAIAATALYALLSLSSFAAFPTVIGVYILAQLAGVLSSIPGGIGIFETVMLLMLSPVIPSVQLLGTLLVFRIIHRIIPMLLAIAALLIYEARNFSKS